uniref:Protein takeout n=1 Tax=Cacopsylla melanoneura TaxID=428564 RepID=A0A8D8YMH6_9HEMI
MKMNCLNFWLSVATIFVINIQRISWTNCLKLPSYTKPCSRHDPKLNECVVRHGQAAIPLFINGDPKYRVPKMDPLYIKQLTVNQGSRQIGLALTLKNFNIYGLKNIKFKKARTELEKRHIEWDFEIPSVLILGQYDISGKVLILPITGTGDANVTITNLKITYKYDWVYVTRKGKQYMNITSSKLLFENGRTYFDLKNLFNGDKMLGGQMNYFLNDNWADITKELGPAVGDAIGEVFRQLLTSIAELVPWEYIYPEKV